MVSRKAQRVTRHDRLTQLPRSTIFPGLYMISRDHPFLPWAKNKVGCPTSYVDTVTLQKIDMRV